MEAVLADKITGEAGYDTVEGDGIDKIDGGEGDDRIKGGKGNDEIKGEEGDDSLKGGKGNEEIHDGIGNDKIDGWEGVDELKGGEGSNFFTCDSFDKLLDFDSKEGDTISCKCTYEDESANNTQK